jgi:cell division protein FtsZ
MDENLTPQTPVEVSRKNISAKMFGVGNAGIKVLEQLARCPLPGVTFVALDTDAPALAASSVPEKICLDPKSPRAARAGGGRERGGATGEQLAQLKAACEGADVIFVVAGLGGGAGTGLSPVLARAARESGALVLGFVTLPFDCEGNRRQRHALAGLEELKQATDGVICLPNQKIFKLIGEDTSVIETFEMAGGLLAEGVVGVWRLMAHKGLIEIHFADLCALLRDRHGESSFAAAEAAGAARSREVLDKLLGHPLFDGGTILSESDAVLVSLVGGPDLTMSEVHRVMEHLSGKCARAQIIMGAAIDEVFRERLAIAVIATRRSDRPDAEGDPGETAPAATRSSGEPLEALLLNRSATARPHSRFVPPPPALPPDKMDQLIARQAAGTPRPRKVPSRMRQGQLPLEILSKGRFDKSEPTIHKGEDLDVPTYIRRGVALN